MKELLIAGAMAVFSAGCTTVTPMHVGGINTAYYIDCTFNGMQSCLSKANNVCPKGWTPEGVDNPGYQGSFAVSPFGGMAGNQLSATRMVIRCRG